jgi:hypothetical protein
MSNIQVPDYFLAVILDKYSKQMEPHHKQAIEQFLGDPSEFELQKIILKENKATIKKRLDLEIDSTFHFLRDQVNSSVKGIETDYYNPVRIALNGYHSVECLENIIESLKCIDKLIDDFKNV